MIIDDQKELLERNIVGVLMSEKDSLMNITHIFFGSI